jgi:phosphoserine phosphatase
MVSRRPDQRPVLILDLDGTVLTVNSFHHWVLYLARARFPHLSLFGRLHIAGATVALLARRKLGLLRHEAFKWHLQQLWQTATVGDGGVCEKALVRELMRFVRPELASVLSAIAAGKTDAILATAAAGDYATALGRRLGFADVLATLATRAATEPSNVGEHKRDAVLRLIAQRGWEDRPRVLFTDHADDLPLIRICDTVYWFGSPADRDHVVRHVPAADFRVGYQDSRDISLCLA